MFSLYLHLHRPWVSSQLAEALTVILVFFPACSTPSCTRTPCTLSHVSENAGREDGVHIQRPIFITGILYCARQIQVDLCLQLVKSVLFKILCAFSCFF